MSGRGCGFAFLAPEAQVQRLIWLQSMSLGVCAPSVTASWSGSFVQSVLGLLCVEWKWMIHCNIPHLSMVQWNVLHVPLIYSDAW